MTRNISPWSCYAERLALPSAGRTALVAAFANLVAARAGFRAFDLPDIFAAPEDEGDNDACRDLVRLDAELLAGKFVRGQIQTFARPLGGGEIIEVAPDKWEIDDPLPRFATGAFNLDRWAEPEAEHTHRLFVDSPQFDRWLAALKPPGPLTVRQVEAIVDPQLRAARSVAAAAMSVNAEAVEVTEAADQGTASGPTGLGPVLMDLREVTALTKLSRSTIYELKKVGKFPEQVKLGASSRWKRSEVLAWIEEQAAKRGS